jgi:hypothetical protein
MGQIAQTIDPVHLLITAPERTKKTCTPSIDDGRACFLYRETSEQTDNHKTRHE